MKKKNWQNNKKLSQTKDWWLQHSSEFFIETYDQDGYVIGNRSFLIRRIPIDGRWIIIDACRPTLCLRKDMLWDYRKKAENSMMWWDSCKKLSSLIIDNDFADNCLYSSRNFALDHLRKYIEEKNNEIFGEKK